ncbi:MAG: glycerol-3-phosphate dehydrogenase [Candidatus Nealsonbacteria bacterium CG_4_10_14_0_2_um_filter_35_20]|uniref:Glycerol-3-phosphate dehydrogenase [NAD(P)+] n=1 Tax=Candidatus Nealsonbacteria bacterium CG02_land_8_20_14_3_00_34_20 TaxID=1974698 RepID=A0A2M7DAL5_9BACT|nr:MAG: glycerol-3-phosphate dehydrogenase [Candidatus Nealsonbacteria bacterium CG02_land_8_20_14_3_00_34_20]PIW92621.1 MAG: glycerol-3-phosphate dehydrogenase [Candidatus Nealsonbacteria bacterium CG_4_8_14_3_um_filter_34_13]PIZ90093.1 MAG: glycerol-3-phosphate dehydrogenase [Candidatus Nealsonbacteria bacterium CG_4_10_14_0_2_um_filter_35_20]
MVSNGVKEKITILGDGAWGTTLAILLSEKGYDVLLWGNFPDYLNSLERKRENVKFLPKIKISPEVKFEKNIQKAVNSSNIIILAIPSKYFRQVVKKLKKDGEKISFSGKIFISVAKGIERKTFKRMSEIIKEELPGVCQAVLSGPTIAPEVARKLPAVAVIASSNINIAKKLQRIFSTDFFRIYTSSDMVGVELGGALKNIIAIAAGISDGLGFGANAKAAILSRGIVEIQRLGKKLGAEKRTFWGISGLGDLSTTCISQESRNRTLGERIGKGEKLKDILNSMVNVAEGVTTTEAAYRLSKIYSVDMPITKEIYLILYKNKSPQKAIQSLMQRKRKRE